MAHSGITAEERIEMKRYQVWHKGTLNGIAYSRVVKAFVTRGSAKRFADRMNREAVTFADGFYSVVYLDMLGVR